MQIPKPQDGIFTVYSKTGCNYCIKVKQLLEEKNQTFTIINCDNFILENKEEFLLFMQQLIGKEYRMFPMVFDNNVFIGGYNETLKHLELKNFDKSKSLDFDSDF
jgi:glutaredoxin